MSSTGEANDGKYISASVDENINQTMAAADISLKSCNEVFLKQALSKMTPNTFDTLLENIKELNITTDVQLNEIVSLIFERAIFEQTYPCIYAQLCCKMSEGFDAKFKRFKKAVISKCQNEFQNHVIVDDTVVAKKLEPFVQKIEEATNPDEKGDSQTNYEYEQWKLKRRSIGILQFIAELFKTKMLTPNIMMNCVQALLDRSSERKLECLCKLLTVIGSRMETSDTPSSSRDLSRCFQTLKEIVENKNQTVEISSRVKFMVQDVINLRKYNWIPQIQIKTGNIDTRSNAERKNVKSVNYDHSGGSKRGNRRGGVNYNKFSGSNRSDRRGGSSQDLPQSFMSQNVNDSMRPGSLSPFWSDDSDAPPVSIQGLSILEANHSGSIDNNKTSYSMENHRKNRLVSKNNKWRNDSKRDSAKPMTESSKQSAQPQKTAVQGEIDQESGRNMWAMVRELYNSSVVTHQKPTNRIFAGEVVCTWINRKLITVNDNFRALEEFFETVLDSSNPMIWEHIAEFITPAIKQNFLTLKQIRSVCADEYVMEEILQHLIPYLLIEHGPRFIRDLFKECEWFDLISAIKVNKFIQKHKFEFVKDNKVIVQRTATGPTNIDRIQTRVKEFLNYGAELNDIQEFITVNLAKINVEFIEALTTVVMEFLMKDETYRFNSKQYVLALALLSSYIGEDIHMQLQGLNAIQILMNRLQYPKIAIQMIFSRLCEAQVVFKDAFYMWRDSEDILEGKSKALSKLQVFFESIDKEDNPEEI